jgi:predicted small integral membrane protein
MESTDSDWFAWSTWMAWTWPTGLFFIAIALTLVAYTVWGVRVPPLETRGFLPMSTTRGDRLFLGLVASAYINLAWAFWDGAPQSLCAVIWVPILLVIGRWG